MKAALIAVGNEIISGFTLDTNSRHISRVLAGVGVDVVLHVSVGDDPGEMKKALENGLAAAPLAVLTGGLGPTDDDITRGVVAEHFGLDLAEIPGMVKEIRVRFESMGLDMPVENARQAFIPEGAEPIDNDLGTAPGFILEQSGKTIVCLPGVPSEMSDMLSSTVVPKLLSKLDPSGPKTMSDFVALCGLPESRIDEILAADGMTGLDRNPVLGLLPKNGVIKVRVTARAPNAVEAGKLLERDIARLYKLFPGNIFARADDSIAGALVRLLAERDLTIAVGESCTGGLIGHEITNVPGASKHFLRGVVAYSNEAKIELLGVDEQLIIDYGAVSVEVARAMAEGARKSAGADIGLGVSGIAGPSGGTPEKPVGTVCIAAIYKEYEISHLFNFPKGREIVKEWAATYALDAARRVVLKDEGFVD